MVRVGKCRVCWLDLSKYGEHFTRKMEFLHGDYRKFVRLNALEYRNQRRGSLKIT